MKVAVSGGVMGVTVVLIVLAAISVSSLLYAANVSASTTTTTQTTTSHQTSTLTVTQTATQAKNVVNLDIIADWGGAGYDAFVVPSSINGTVPKPAPANGTPGPNDNNVTVTAGTPTTFVITNLDTATFPYAGQVAVPFTVYNDTESGYVTNYYQAGQSVNMSVSHTFTISSLNLSIPTPPDTVISFTYTFANPGVYMYMCMTPCGPGMITNGYMIGFVIAK